MSEKLTNSAPPPPSPSPPARPAAAPPKQSRRRFLTLIAVVGGLLSLAPWVPFGTYLSASVGGSSSATKNQTIVLDNNSSENGSAAGKTVNVNDLASFPPNAHWVMTYPSSGDPNLDGQNPNTFVKFELIRLPTELGGGNKDASAFVAFSKVCVHLWCSPNYNPTQCSTASENGYVSGPDCSTHELYECPCHGSGYSVGLNGETIGKALIGPAAVQPPPTNAIPLLTLATDSAGNLQVVPPIWDVDHNGVVGYGRNTGNGAFTGGYNPQ
jgi:rieske iron-sulfur protein